MAACDRAHPKELFGPWLIRQINNNSYGLSWQNPEKTIFCIPWKHLARKDITGQDYELFKAWAIHGGKYSERPEDRSTWKTNFRCALNSVSVKEKKISCKTQDGATMKDKKLFTEVEDRSSDPHNPHKVYRLIHAPDGSNYASATSSANHSGLPDCEEEEETLRISPDFLEIPNFKTPRPQPDEAPIEDILEFLSLDPNAVNVVLGQSVITNGHREENGYHPEEAEPAIYSVPLSQQNGYHCLQQSTLQWCQAEEAAPVTNCLAYQQETWTPLAASCSQENKAVFINQTIIQNGHGEGVPVSNGDNYITVNSAAKNSFQSWAPQWTIEPAVPGYSPIQNGFASPTAAFRQNKSPQHQLTLFPIGKQHQDAATDPAYSNHGAQNGYFQEAPSGNGAKYSRNSSPVENSYHSVGSRWPNPAVPEHQPTENGYGYQQGNAEQEQHPSLAVQAQIHNLSLNCPRSSSLDVTIFYKGNEVLHQQVTKRCLLTFNPQDSSLGEVEAVHFPRPDNIRDQKQLEYTQRLLDSVQRGLLLEVNPEEKILIATRLGKCKVFWAFSEELGNMAERVESRMLQREIPERIFDFNTFWTELREYRQQTRRASPDYSIYLCFGQWLTEKPKEKKLILVKIVPRFCSFFHELIQGEGASSLNSETISLQISNGSSINCYDLLESSLMDIDLPY
ncbi:interferon regulatory factor 3-like [Pleurodeles waltl]